MTEDYWELGWPPREEVDEWAATVAAEGLGDCAAGLAEMFEGGFSLDEAIDAMIADARVDLSRRGIDGFQLEALLRGLRRCLEAERAHVEIQLLPERSE